MLKEKIINSVDANNEKRRGYLEYGPLILFFITNYFYGIIIGTAILVFATVISLSLSWILDRKIPLLASFGCCTVVLFGGLTLIFNDDFFIKIKPTIMCLLLSSVLLFGFFTKKNILKYLLSNQLILTEKGWKQITLVWTFMFFVSAIANEIAWRNLTTDSWVTFKVFGLTGISMFFALLSIPIMTKNSVNDDSK